MDDEEAIEPTVMENESAPVMDESVVVEDTEEAVEPEADPSLLLPEEEPVDDVGTNFEATLTIIDEDPVEELVEIQSKIQSKSQSRRSTRGVTSGSARGHGRTCRCCRRCHGGRSSFAARRASRCWHSFISRRLLLLFTAEEETTVDTSMRLWIQSSN